MWCTYKGHVCVMVTEKSSGKVKFIREKMWLKMSDAEKSNYEW